MYNRTFLGFTLDYFYSYMYNRCYLGFTLHYFDLYMYNGRYLKGLPVNSKYSDLKRAHSSFLALKIYLFYSPPKKNLRLMISFLF